MQIEPLLPAFLGRNQSFPMLAWFFTQNPSRNARGTWHVLTLAIVHLPFSRVTLTGSLGKFQMNERLSLCLVTYEEPETLTRSSYGNLSRESCCGMCKKNGIEPYRSLVPSGFGDLFQWMNLCRAFFFRVKHCCLKENFFPENSLSHSADSFPGEWFFLFPFIQKKEIPFLEF